MEAVCEVAGPTWYRNTTGPEGSPERVLWVCVWLCVLVWVWLVLRPSLDEWICGSACMDSPPSPDPIPPSFLSLCLFPSLHPSLFLQMDTMDAWEGIALWEGGTRPNALACEWVDMWQQKVYMNLCVCVFVFLLGDALSSALLHSHSGWKSLLASSLGPYYRLISSVCVCVLSCVCVCVVVTVNNFVCMHVCSSKSDTKCVVYMPILL